MHDWYWTDADALAVIAVANEQVQSGKPSSISARFTAGFHSLAVGLADAGDGIR